METDALLSAIKGYCAAAGMKPTTFGFRAVNDGKLVSRLEAKGQCLPSTTARIRRFIEDNPPAAACAKAS